MTKSHLGIAGPSRDSSNGDSFTHLPERLVVWPYDGVVATRSLHSITDPLCQVEAGAPAWHHDLVHLEAHGVSTSGRRRGRCAKGGQELRRIVEVPVILARGVPVGALVNQVHGGLKGIKKGATCIVKVSSGRRMHVSG